MPSFPARCLPAYPFLPSQLQPLPMMRPPCRPLSFPLRATQHRSTKLQQHDGGY